MLFSFLFAGVCGIAFGLLQARWTGKAVHAGENRRRMLVLTLLKLLSWLLVMAAFALYNITSLIIFVLCAGLGMVAFTVYLWRKSLKEPDQRPIDHTNHQEVAH